MIAVPGLPSSDQTPARTSVRNCSGEYAIVGPSIVTCSVMRSSRCVLQQRRQHRRLRRAHAIDGAHGLDAAQHVRVRP